MRRHALEHDRSRVFESDTLGQRDHSLPRHYGVFGVGTARHRVCDSLSNGKTHALPNRRDGSSAFAAKLHRVFRSFICAVAKVYVDEVDTDGFELDQDLAWRGLRRGLVDVFEGFGPAERIGDYSFHVADSTTAMSEWACVSRRRINSRRSASTRARQLASMTLSEMPAVAQLR